MDTGLVNQISQNQQLTLTPKMVEELKVLQMSYIDLVQYIDMQLNENPLLETEDDYSEYYEISGVETSLDNLDRSELEEKVQIKDFTEYSSKSVTLRQHLLLQIGELSIDTETRRISFYLIETINEEGYLCANLSDVSNTLGVSVDKVKIALGVIQKLEPAGIGARNLKECILLQLKRKKQLNDSIKNVVINYLDQLAKRKYKCISEKLGLPVDKIVDICHKIKSTNPKPGLKYSDNCTAGYIKPELTVKKIDGKFIVLFNDESIVNLKVSEYYGKLLKSGESSIETRKYIKYKVSKAMEIINAIEQRKRTVLYVSICIIEHQEDFLKKGHMYLQPLTLKMIAEKVGLHESTISRTVREKYIETPRGVFELKFFFSSQIDASGDTSIAASAVKKAIRDIVQNEDRKSPLSDERIRKLLEDNGILIARRTVAKYREELSIFPAKMRKLS